MLGIIMSLLLSGCSYDAPEITCNKPYILVGISCCLDQNDNSICDTDETPEPEESIEEETLITGLEESNEITGKITADIGIQLEVIEEEEIIEEIDIQLEVVEEEEPYICNYNAYNCGNFNTHTEAQTAFEYCGGVSNDIHDLDRDSDGVACESLP